MNEKPGRDEYVRRFKQQIDGLNADMARWEAKATAAKQEVQGRMAREIDVLKAQRELARYNLQLLENASLGAWAELRKGADDAWDRMRLAAEAAATYFGEVPQAKPSRPRH